MKGTRLPNVWVMTSEFHPQIIGGLGTAATDLCRSLANQKANITVWCDNGTGRYSFERREGQFIYRLPKSTGFFDAKDHSFLAGRMKQLASRLPVSLPDVIHVHSVEFANAALLFKKKYRIPVIYTCHSLVMKSKSPRLMKRRNLQFQLFREANRIVAPSRWLRIEIRKLNSAYGAKTVVIPHGTAHQMRRKKVPVNRMLYVGRLVEPKGVVQLVKAIALLAPKHKDIRLTIIGSGSNVFRKRILSFIRSRRLSPHIRLLGYIKHNHVQRLYASYGTVIVPSREGESFCLVALEAMAKGVPLISTRAGGLGELVNRRIAKIIPAVTSRHIAKAIHEVLINPLAAEKRASLARTKARQYSWPRAAEMYARLYHALRRG